MENIGKINGYGGYSVGGGQIGSGKRGEEKNETSTDANLNNQGKENANPNDILNALGMVGSQNMAFISRNAGVGDVETAKNYLGDERVSSIEAMMAEFENGVNDIEDVIDEEFGDIFSAPEKKALAAKIFAQE